MAGKPFDPATDEQSARLAEEFAPWLEVIDEALCEADVPLSQRPLRALTQLLIYDLIETRAGDTQLPGEDILKKPDQMLFRILFAAVERWYLDRFGPEAMGRGDSGRLRGVVLIHGAPYAVDLPTNRAEVRVDGEQSWMHFEEGIGEGEDPVAWLVHPPALDRLDPEARVRLDRELEAVASTLRYVEFRRVSWRGTEESAPAASCWRP